ncbi:hypothetical protein AGMMS49992_15740 [Clostridia bacterium]|nr:hypothetical protein AGMMS49992_15740 [Clostridia bacterium]
MRFPIWFPRSIRFYKSFFSFLLIVILILAFTSIFIISANLKEAEKSIRQGSQDTLQNVAVLFDNRLKELNTLAVRIDNNEKLQSRGIYENAIGEVNAIKELKNYRLLNTFLKEIVLFYYSNDDMQIYTSQYKYNAKTFFSIFSFSNWSEDALISYRLQNTVPAALPMMQVIQHDGSQIITNCLCRFAALPLGTSASNCILLFLIDEYQLNELARTALGGQEGIFTIESGDTTYYRYISTSHPKGASPSKDHTIVTANSQVMPWVYSISIQSTLLLANVREMRNRSILILSTFFLAGVALSFYLANKQYYALKKVAGKLTKTDGADELLQLSDGLDTILQQNRVLLEQLDTQQEALQNNKNISLLLGTQDDVYPLAETWKHRCGVILVMVDEVMDWQKQHSNKERNILCNSICKILEETAQEFGNGYSVCMPDGVSCALLMDADTDQDMKQLAVEVHASLRQYFTFSCTVGVSGLWDSPEDAHQCYLEASAAVQHRFLSGGGQVLFFHALQGTRNTGNTRGTDHEVAEIYPLEKARALASHIRQGEKDAACETLHSIMEYFNTPDLPSEEALLAIANLINILKQVQSDLRLNLTTPQRQMIRMLLGQVTTFEQTQEWLFDIVETLCQEAQDKHNEIRNMRMKRMLSIIHEHYNEPTFCLNQIAEEMQLSPSHTTTLFKEYTGETLMSYVDALRIQNAVILVETTKLPIREIVSQVGYTDPTNFIRKFKALKGMTPTSYRQVAQNTEKKP